MSLSSYGADLIAETLVEYLPDLYLALLASEPSVFDDGDGLFEPSDLAYIRQYVSLTSNDWTSADNGNVLYSLGVSFPTATEDWPSIEYWALCTAQTGGQLVMWGSFTGAKEVPNGQTLTVPAESFGFYLGGV